jgi:hypothetical protein
LIAKGAGGTLGVGGEQVVREALIWVPGFMHTIGVSRVEGRIKKVRPGAARPLGGRRTMPQPSHRFSARLTAPISSA